MVKQTANLEGASMTTGRKRVKAKSRNKRPAPRSAQKYVRLVVERVGNLRQGLGLLVHAELVVWTGVVLCQHA